MNTESNRVPHDEANRRVKIKHPEISTDVLGCFCFNIVFVKILTTVKLIFIMKV